MLLKNSTLSAVGTYCAKGGAVIDAAENNAGHIVIKHAVAYVKEIGSADTQRELLALLGQSTSPKAAA